MTKILTEQELNKKKRKIKKKIYHKKFNYNQIQNINVSNVVKMYIQN